MKDKNPESGPKKHPIQLIHLSTRELYIKSNVVPSQSIGAQVKNCSIGVGASPYDKVQNAIAVSLKLETGTGARAKSAPYTMRIELVGIFKVDESQFPAQHVLDWAHRNAPLILYPYLREHAYALSSRCGFTPLVLPLVEVPTFNLEKSAKRKKKPQ